jgi:hypothetical protein
MFPKYRFLGGLRPHAPWLRRQADLCGTTPPKHVPSVSPPVPHDHGDGEGPELGRPCARVWGGDVCVHVCCHVILCTGVTSHLSCKMLGPPGLCTGLRSTRDIHFARWCNKNLDLSCRFLVLLMSYATDVSCWLWEVSWVGGLLAWGPVGPRHPPLPIPGGLRRIQDHAASFEVALASPAHRLGCSGPSSCWAYLGSGLTAFCGQARPPAGRDTGRLPHLAGGLGPGSSPSGRAHAYDEVVSWTLLASSRTHVVPGPFGVDVQDFGLGLPRGLWVCCCGGSYGVGIQDLWYMVARLWRFFLGVPGYALAFWIFGPSTGWGIRSMLMFAVAATYLLHHSLPSLVRPCLVPRAAVPRFMDGWGCLGVGFAHDRGWVLLPAGWVGCWWLPPPGPSLVCRRGPGLPCPPPARGRLLVLRRVGVFGSPSPRCWGASPAWLGLGVSP